MLYAEQKIRSYPSGYDQLGALFSRFVKGIFDINSGSYVDHGVPFIRIQNLKNGLIDVQGMAFIPRSINDEEHKTQLLKGDIVLSKTGYPAASLVSVEYANTSQDTIATTLSEYGQLHYNASTIVAYLNSSIGNSLLWRQFQGNVQLHLSLDDGRKVPIPRISEKLQVVIDNCFVLSQRLRDVAAERIAEADQSLLQALGLSNWQPPEPLSYTSNSSDAFAAGRLDAEHFQPKFQALLAHLLATGRAKTFGEVLLLNQRGKQPDYIESGVPVVNSKHINKGEVRIDSDNRCAQTDDETVLIQPGDVVMNGTGVGTIGRAAPYLHNFGAVPDNHVTILKPKPGMDAVYLSVFINSLAGQMQVAQRLRGSSGQIELYPNDIARFMVWDAPEEVQANIRQLVIQSFEAKQRATQLLDAAKRAVEIAIEESEDAALAHLQLVAKD